MRLAALLAVYLALAGCAAPTNPTATIAAVPAVSGALDSGLTAIGTKYGLDKTWFYLSRDNGQREGSSHGDPQGLGRPLQIGSLSKSVTGIGIALLVQDGKLRLNSTLGEVLPRYLQGKNRQLDPSLAPVDIRHLLAHRAGLRANGTSDPVNGLSSRTALDDMPADAHFSEYMFATGNEKSDGTSEYRYSNLSFLVLGMVIEAVSGQRYDDFIRERVFVPLGIAGDIAPTLRRVAPFGGWEMTEPDLLKLWTVFDVNRPTLLTRATLEATLLSQALPPIAPNSTVHYTMGTLVRQSGDGRSYVVSHNGIVDFLRGQPNVYAYAEKYVPGYSWTYIYELPARTRSANERRRSIEREVRALVESVEGQ